MGDEHDVAWQLAGHQIIPRASVAMHATVVAPIFALTQGEPRLAAVESSYKDALRELKPDGNLSDPITDAARALQEMLVVAGARGDSLGRLLPREWVRRSGEMYYNPMNCSIHTPNSAKKLPGTTSPSSQGPNGVCPGSRRWRCLYLLSHPSIDEKGEGTKKATRTRTHLAR